VRAYLLAIARNVFLKGLRHQRREVALDEALPDPAPPPDASRAVSAELDRVLEALGRLPEVDRTALLLRVDEGLPYEDIAAILKIAPVAARVKVHRARAKLAAAREDVRR
jgi:RNA polymerase sigma-70 factor (ECF subfamily)